MKPALTPTPTPDPYDEGSNAVVIGIITSFRKELAEYEDTNSRDRAQFKQSIEDSLVQLRKDFNRALQPVLLETLDSRQSRIDLQNALDRDNVARVARQTQVDKQFTIFIIVLVAVVVVVVIMFIVLVVRIVIVSSAS